MKLCVMRRFKYKNPDTFQKASLFPLRFYIQKARHFTLHNFSWKCWIWHIYTTIMTLFVTWRFYIQKAWHLAKSKTICVTFFYTKIRTLCVRQFFIECLKLVFIYKNHDTFRYVTFLYTKSQTIRKNQDILYIKT